MASAETEDAILVNSSHRFCSVEKRVRLVTKSVSIREHFGLSLSSHEAAGIMAEDYASFQDAECVSDPVPEEAPPRNHVLLSGRFNTASWMPSHTR